MTGLVDVVDAVQLALEKEGTLLSIRAQLRYSVLKVLNRNSSDDAPSNKSAIDAFIDSYGRLSFDLVREFLVCLNLKESLCVFDAETGLSPHFETQKEVLARQLQMDIIDKKRPLLIDVINAKCRYGPLGEISDSHLPLKISRPQSPINEATGQFGTSPGKKDLKNFLRVDVGSAKGSPSPSSPSNSQQPSPSSLVPSIISPTVSGSQKSPTALGRSLQQLPSQNALNSKPQGLLNEQLHNDGVSSPQHQYIQHDSLSPMQSPKGNLHSPLTSISVSPPNKLGHSAGSPNSTSPSSTSSTSSLVPTPPHAAMSSKALPPLRPTTLDPLPSYGKEMSMRGGLSPLDTKSVMEPYDSADNKQAAAKGTTSPTSHMNKSSSPQNERSLEYDAVDNSLEEVPEDDIHEVSASQESFGDASQSFEKDARFVPETKRAENPMIGSSTRQMRVQKLHGDVTTKEESGISVKQAGFGVTRSKKGWNDERNEENDDFIFAEEDKDSVNHNHSPVGRGYGSRGSSPSSVRSSRSTSPLQPIPRTSTTAVPPTLTSSTSHTLMKGKISEDESFDLDDSTDMLQNSRRSNQDEENESDLVSQKSATKTGTLFTAKVAAQHADPFSSKTSGSPNKKSANGGDEGDDGADDYDDEDFEEEIESVQEIEDEDMSIGNNSDESDENPYGFDDSPKKPRQGNDNARGGLSRTNSGTIKTYSGPAINKDESSHNKGDSQQKSQTNHSGWTTSNSKRDDEKLSSLHTMKGLAKSDISNNNDIIEDLESSVASDDSDALQFSTGGKECESGSGSFSFVNDSRVETKGMGTTTSRSKSKLEKSDLDFSASEMSGSLQESLDYTASALPPSNASKRR